MAGSSRIFVRGLPPNMKEEEFRSHFSKPSAITDAKLIPRRRIGYVGYKSPEAASKAVEYYNKTFIRMSKILVEFAKPASEIEAEQKEKLQDHHVVRPFKEKTENNERGPEDPKLQEFLRVMQPRSKQHVLLNEEAMMNKRDDPQLDDTAPVPSSVQSDPEYEPVAKRRKVSPAVEEGALAKRHLDIDAEAVETKAAITASNADQNTMVDAETDTNFTNAPASDADWLRSRTSRLLGLLEDDEVDDAPKGTRSRVPDGATLNVAEETTESKFSDSGGKTNGEMVDAEMSTSPQQKDETYSLEAGRLFIRNLPYQASNKDLRQHFSAYGPIEEVHISMDPHTNQSKGFAYIRFEDTKLAARALEELDGRPFQGRLLHIIPASSKKNNVMDEYAISKLPHKKQQQIRRRAEAASATFKWNSLYMNADAVMSSIADRLGVSKSAILDPTSSDAAVKQAHAESNIIQEVKAYLANHGVDINAFKKHEFSDTTILVKNFAYGTTAEEIRQLFEAHGTVKKLLMPPSGTIAIVDLEQPGQARAAFSALAYRRFKESVLFLEKAPRGIFEVNVPVRDAAIDTGTDNNRVIPELDDEEAGKSLTSTLYVRNLSFDTTSAKLHDLFSPLQGFLSAKVKTKTDPKKPGQVLSMGFGFVEFRNKEDALAGLHALNGYRLDGHEILIKPSHKSLDAAEERRREDMALKIAQKRTKIIIKNLPFETTKRDVRELFAPYGKLRSVRVPKKFDSSTRGFAFADFITAKEAQNAMSALAGAHLLGRRLNLEFAADDAIDPEEEIENMSKKMGKQADKVALRKLTAGGRKKFSVNNEEDIE